MRQEIRDRILISLCLLVTLSLCGYFFQSYFTDNDDLYLPSSAQELEVAPSSPEARRFESAESERGAATVDLVAWDDPAEMVNDELVHLDLRVLDRNGKPLVGATIKLDAFADLESVPKKLTEGADEVGTTDEDGCYRSRRSGRIFSVCALLKDRRVTDIHRFKLPLGRKIISTLGICHVQGRIETEEGLPAGGARVHGNDPRWMNGGEDCSLPASVVALADSEGRFTLELPIGARYAVQARWNDSKSRVVHIGSLKEGENIIMDLFMEGRFTIEAQLRTGTGKMLNRPHLKVVAEDSMSEILGGRIKAGRYSRKGEDFIEIQVPFPGRYRILGVADSELRSTLQPVEVSRSSPHVKVVVFFEEAHHYQIKFLDAQVQPIVGARVFLFPALASLDQLGREVIGLFGYDIFKMGATTNENGVAEFQVAFEELKFDIQVQLPGTTMPMTLRTAHSFSVPNEVIQILASQERRLEIRGRLIHAESGRPASGTKLTVVADTLGFNQQETIARHDGRFVFAGLPGNQSYRVLVESKPEHAGLMHRIEHLERDMDILLTVMHYGGIELAFVNKEGVAAPLVEFKMVPDSPATRSYPLKELHADLGGFFSQGKLDPGYYEVIQRETGESLGRLEILPDEVTKVIFVVP